MREFLFLLMCVPFIVCKGQDGIQMPFNMLCNGDMLVKRQISANTMSQRGEDVLWDISGADVMNKQCKVKYQDVAGSKHRVACVEQATMYYYDLQHDTLFVGGIENNTTKIDYDIKEIYLRFPMRYGDSYSGVFHGTGTYCDRIAVRSFGTYKIEADATGTLILPEGDTLRNVIRLHTERFIASIHYPADSLKSISDSPFNTDSIGKYTSNNKYIMKKDIYRWYAAGYRYPVMETNIVYIHGREHEPYITSFYYPISGQDLYGGNETDENPDARAPHVYPTPNKKPVELSYNIYRNGNESVSIEYSLPVSAEISYGIYTTDGKSVYNSEKTKATAGKHHADMDISGWQDGVYIICIHADENIYTEKLILKR